MKTIDESLIGNKELILVVDDDHVQRDVAEKILKRLNYIVYSVEGGRKALEYLNNNKVDLILIDMVMAPDMDGLDTFLEIKQRNPEQKAILVSGYDETMRVKKAQKLGACIYLKKPFTMEKIGLAVKSAIRSSC